MRGGKKRVENPLSLRGGGECVWLHLAVVVADDDAFEAWDDFFDGGLVDGVWEVSVAGGGAFEEHHKAVREAVAEAFGAVIDAPGEVENSGDLFWQVLDDVPDVGDVGGGAGIFELKEGDMFGSGGHGQIVGKRTWAVKPDLRDGLRMWGTGCGLWMLAGG